MKPVVNLYKLGRLPYVKALNVQQKLFDKLKHSVTSSGYDLPIKTDSQVRANLDSDRRATKNSSDGFQHPAYRVDGGNSLILVEHEPVYTIGIRSKQYNDKYVSQLKEKLDEHKLKADFVETNRGGLITFHGPGQLVAYPIIYLGDFKTTIRNKSVKAYVNLLENTIIDTLASVGIKGAHTVKEYPGVWLDDGERKIAFIGITCKRYVTMHGVSINCDCELSWFDHIVSCGIEDKSITSIGQELRAMEQIHDRPLKTDKTKHEMSGKSDELIFLDKPATHLFGESETCSSKPDIESISKAFCVSFSRHFDCNIVENLNFELVTQPSIEGKINSFEVQPYFILSC